MPMQFYDRQGKPLASTIEWGDLFEDLAHRHVAFDTVAAPKGSIANYRVSTAWFGFDLRNPAGANGPPLIFETLILDGPRRGDGDRYATEAEALAGHRRIVQELAAQCGKTQPEAAQ